MAAAARVQAGSRAGLLSTLSPTMAAKKLIRSLHVRPGTAAGLAGRDPGDRLGFPDKQAGLERLDELVTRLGSLHNRLWAESRRSLLLVLQGLDASGKDGT